MLITQTIIYMYMLYYHMFALFIYGLGLWLFTGIFYKDILPIHVPLVTVFLDLNMTVILLSIRCYSLFLYNRLLLGLLKVVIVQKYTLEVL